MARRLVLTAMLLLGACGGDSEEGDTTAPPGSGSAITDPSRTDPPVTDPPATDPPATDPPATDLALSDGGDPPNEPEPPLDEHVWELVTAEAPWEPRAGLRVVDLDGRLFLLGGRTPNQSEIPGDSVIHGDVWVSDDLGATWTEIVESAPWPARAYFQAVVKDGAIYVIGGQDFGLEENPFCELLDQGLEPPPGLGIDPDAPCPEFLPTSNFFNDVWRSTDGVTWEQLAAAAPWDGRAGLSAVVFRDDIYVMAGSQNDDSSIIGPGGPARIYFDDVWRSSDGAEWDPVTDDAPWAPRAGAAIFATGDSMWLFGGEDGFTCDPLPDCEPPYFNDVWVSNDGARWREVDESAGWSPRPGHVCELVGNQSLCFGGFGLVENPTDMWWATDGATWTELAQPPWGSDDPADVKYDFDALVVDGSTVLTFGGDRETFDFTDPENYLRVDNDVWAFTPPA